MLTWKGVVILAWLALLFAGERLAPAAPLPPALRSGDETRPAWRRVGRNLGLWLLNVGLSPLVVLPVSYWASTHALGWRPDWWSGAGGLLLDLLLLDFLIYWWHRANHVVPFLWRFHQVHHLDRFLDTTSALRFHFGEILLSAAARAGVIVLLDIPFQSILIFEALVLLATIFHHSNLRLPARLEAVLSRIFVTPSIHWVHHHAVRRDTDSNYATVLSLWDPLFGSRSGTRRSTDLEIGVEGRRELTLPRLLWAPFRSRSAG